MDKILGGLVGSPNFDTAARIALSYLRGKMGFDLWMITRVEGDEWIVLNAEDHGYGVAASQVFRWEDSFCSRMVRGLGPQVAASAQNISAYAEAPISAQFQIGAYIGVPLVNLDGTLFGTLCAIDPCAKPDSIQAELPLLELIAKMLSGILAAEIAGNRLSRQAEQAWAEAETDALTGLYNRRGWERILLIEEAACLRYGHPACVLVVDLDGLKAVNDTHGHSAGDELIALAASALKAGIRKSDRIARVGGDEFQILCVECDMATAEAMLERVNNSLSQAGVSASIGLARRNPAVGLHEAAKEADRNMYANKKIRKQRDVTREFAVVQTT